MKKLTLILTIICLYTQPVFSQEVVNKRMFPDIPLLGEQSEKEVKSYLYAIGDNHIIMPEEKVKFITQQVHSKSTEMLNLETTKHLATVLSDEADQHWYNFWNKEASPWKHTQSQIGYVTKSDHEYSNVTPGHKVTPENLKKINIKLDKIRVYDYPGSGMHNVLFTFEAINGLENGSKEVLAFNQIYKAAETEGAGVVGYPIFANLNVPVDGISFKVAITNVNNDADEEALKALESKECKAGLTLLSTAQPAIAPFTEIALGVSKMILSRNKNKLVQDVYLGLDRDADAAFGARLNAGNYIVVQAPDKSFKWEDWQYDGTNARLVSKSDHDRLPPYNYFVFRISKVE